MTGLRGADRGDQGTAGEVRLPAEQDQGAPSTHGPGKDITPFIALNEMIFGSDDKPFMDEEPSAPQQA